MKKGSHFTGNNAKTERNIRAKVRNEKRFTLHRQQRKDWTQY